MTLPTHPRAGGRRRPAASPPSSRRTRSTATARTPSPSPRRSCCAAPACRALVVPAAVGGGRAGLGDRVAGGARDRRGRRLHRPAPRLPLREHRQPVVGGRRRGAAALGPAVGGGPVALGRRVSTRRPRPRRWFRTARATCSAVARASRPASPAATPPWCLARDRRRHRRAVPRRRARRRPPGVAPGGTGTTSASGSPRAAASRSPTWRSRREQVLGSLAEHAATAALGAGHARHPAVFGSLLPRHRPGRAGRPPASTRARSRGRGCCPTASTGTADPYVLATYGRLVAATRAVEALADAVADALADRVDAAGGRTRPGRPAASSPSTSPRSRWWPPTWRSTSRTTIFEVTGARATSNAVGLDRFWRNVRTHTLHDPVAYKRREVGDHFLNGTHPPFTLYT